MLKVVTFFFLTALQSLPGSAIFKVIPKNRKTSELFRGNLKVTESCWFRYLGCFSLNHTIWIVSAAHTSQLTNLQFVIRMLSPFLFFAPTFLIFCCWKWLPVIVKLWKQFWNSIKLLQCNQLFDLVDISSLIKPCCLNSSASFQPAQDG